MFNLVAMVVILFAVLGIPTIISEVEALIYNKRGILPKDGSEKFKMQDFFWANFSIPFLCIFISGMISMFTGYFTMMIVGIFIYIVLSSEFDIHSMEKKIDKS